MSITVNDIARVVQGEIPCQKRELFRAINRCLRDINTRLESGILDTHLVFTTNGVMSTAKSLTFAAAGKTITKAANGSAFGSLGFTVGDKLWAVGATETLNIGELTITNVADNVLTVSESLKNETATCTLISYYIENGYSFNNTTRILTLKDQVKSILEVYENYTELENNTYEYVTDSNNSDELAYHYYSRNSIYLPTWLMNAKDDACQIKIMRDLAEITSDDGATVIDIPPQLKNTLINGCLFYLYGIEQYKNPDKMKYNGDLYFGSFEAINKTEHNRSPQTERKRKYIY